MGSCFTEQQTTPSRFRIKQLAKAFEHDRKMSYYRYITGVYKSYWPQLNRTLRSSSCPRTSPDRDLGRYARASTVAPSSFYSNSFFSHEATPFQARALSVPPRVVTTSRSSSSSSYTNFDYKVLDYMGRLERDDSIRNAVSDARRSHSHATSYYRDGDYRSDFSSKYNFYDGNKHLPDYLYSSTSDILGSWKHYNLSSNTINERNTRAKSPLVSRELDRYYETKKRVDYIGDISSGSAKDFRYYHYRRVPYFGGSDNYAYVRKLISYMNTVEVKY